MDGITGTSVLIEAVCVGGKFDLCFNQTFEDDFLVQGLIRYLNDAGVPCALREKRRMQSAGLDLDLIEKA